MYLSLSIYIYIYIYVYVRGDRTNSPRLQDVPQWGPRENHGAREPAASLVGLRSEVIGRDKRDFRQRDCTENRGAIRFFVS